MIRKVETYAVVGLGAPSCGEIRQAINIAQRHNCIVKLEWRTSCTNSFSCLVDENNTVSGISSIVVAIMSEHNQYRYD